LRETHNRQLRFIKPDWKGNPLDGQNRYQNLDGPSHRGFGQVFRWQTASNKYAAEKKGQKTNVKIIQNDDLLNASKDCFTWLGHASFLFQMGDVKIITDPILHTIWPLKRYTDLPISSEALIGIDIILLSHNHRDHADKKSMIQLTRQNPGAVIYTGLGIGNLLRSWGVKNEIVEAGWFQEYPSFGPLTIQYLPAKHWNRRKLFDLNQMLWGSFMIHFEDLSLYFGADSGLGTHFKEIGNLFDIDLAILGIGAYEPIWFMNDSHTSPNDALKAKEELKATLMVPMHYGTFDLSDEPIFNPKLELEKLTKNRNDVIIPDIGEVVELTFTPSKFTL
jgi:L-ascorbate metabolism protein UlaG (beta-lactamase superfamily)